jgi:hypothetical protein
MRYLAGLRHPGSIIKSRNFITAIPVPPYGFTIEDAWQAAGDFVMEAGARILLSETTKSAHSLVHNAYFFVHILGLSG